MKLRKTLFLSFIFCLSFTAVVKAKVSFVNEILQKQDKRYLEDKEHFQDINIVTKDSPLKELKEPGEKFKFLEELENKHAKIVKNYAETFAYNKITGFSNGIIDVTNQVRTGVKAAIKETFGGYAEYQRRKQVEEIANSTFQNRKLMGDLFLRNNNEKLDYDNPFRSFLNIWDVFQEKTYNYQLIRAVSNRRVIKNIRDLVKTIALVILSLLVVVKILSAIKEGMSIQESFTKPVMIVIFAIFGIVTGDLFLSINVNLLNKLARVFTLVLSDFQIQNNLSLDDTWTAYAGSFGYFPTLILSVFDMISQIFIGFFYIALIAYIVFGLIFYPLWIVVSIFKMSKNIALDSYLGWLKANLALVFSPVLIIVFRIISKELSHDYLFMSILSKTLSFYSIPLLCYFIFLKTKPIASPNYEKI